MTIVKGCKTAFLIFILLASNIQAFALVDFRRDENDYYNKIPTGRDPSLFHTQFGQTSSGHSVLYKPILPDVLESSIKKPLGIDAPYCKYNLIYNLAPFYIALDDNLSKIIDNALTSFGIEQIRNLLSSYNLNLIELRSALILLLKSPYYIDGNLVLPGEELLGLKPETRFLYMLAQELSRRINNKDKEYIRNFDVSVVEPDLNPWPEYPHIADVHLKVQGILEGKVDYGFLSAYKDEIERAIVATIAGFNYASDRFSPLSAEFTPQAINNFYQRIKYWLKTQEYIPVNIFPLVEAKAKELFNKLQFRKGLFPASPWQGEITQIYRLFGGEIPTQREQGKPSSFVDWGEDIYKKLWDISSNIEKVYSAFGILLKGPDMTLEQLKNKIELIGPAFVGINRGGRKDFIKVLEIFLNKAGEGTITYQDSGGNIFAMLLSEFFRLWDGFVYTPEEKNISASVISDFDYSEQRFGLIKGYGQWTINEFDDLKAKIGININIPFSENLPYFYTQYEIGGRDTYKYSGYFRTGLWLAFKDGIKSLLLRGSTLSFDTYISDYPGIKYLRIEMKEEETGKIISEFIIPRERLNLRGWNTFKIPIHYYPAGTIVLTVGVIGTYPGLYSPQTHFIAIDRLYIE